MKNMKYIKIIIMTLLFQINFISVSGQLIEAQSSYEVAEKSIETLYLYISDLSKSNQDISSYIEEVNESLEELQLAETAILGERYVESMAHSKEANQIAIEIISEIAETRPRQILFNTPPNQEGLIVQFFLATIIFFLLWNQITTRYNKKILESRPEAINIES